MEKIHLASSCLSSDNLIMSVLNIYGQIKGQI